MNRWVSKVGVFDVDVQANGVRLVLLADETRNVSFLDVDVAKQLDTFIDGDPVAIRLDLSDVTSPIQQLTLAKLLEIPRGEVRSYAWVAREIGHPRAVRAVASAVARNPIPVLSPCHRVVRSDGFIGEFSLGGPEYKRRFLEYEGMSVDDVELMAKRGVRFVADEDANVLHLLTCKNAPTRNAIEVKRVDESYEPCPRCKPF
jgi:O-6-methylguanine DNA methyltransferase